MFLVEQDNSLLIIAEHKTSLSTEYGNELFSLSHDLRPQMVTILWYENPS